MAYIIQIGADVVVKTTDYIGELSQHPSIVEHPDLFEIKEGELPAKYDILNYQSELKN